MDRFSKGSRMTLNLIIFVLFVLTMWFDIAYYHANPAKVGEFLGYTSMIVRPLVLAARAYSQYSRPRELSNNHQVDTPENGQTPAEEEPWYSGLCFR